MYGGTIEAARGAGNHPVIGEAGTGSTRESQHDTFDPTRRSMTQPEDDATTARSGPALAGSSVQIAGSIENQVADRARPITSACEAVEHVLGPDSVGMNEPVD